MSSSKNGTWETSDFSIAAFLHSQGVPLISARLRDGLSSNRRDVDFSFKGTESRCQCAAIQFVNSRVGRYDQSQRSLKKLIFSWKKLGTAGVRGDWSTEDLPLASFIVSRGVDLVGFKRTNQWRKEFCFFFEQGESDCQKLSLDFVNSEEHRFDQSQRALKGLVFNL